MGQLNSRPALVLTNNKELHASVSDTLSTLQYTVFSADNTEEAILRANRKDYLLIVASDEPSSDINSLKFYNKLLQKYPHYARKVLFIADSPTDDYCNIIRRSGSHYINMPYDPSHLVSQIETMRSKNIISENRIANRYKWTGDCVLISGDRIIGETLDISKGGAKINYVGEEIPNSTEVTISIPDIGYYGKARVRWNFHMGDKNMMGLDLESDMQPDYIKKAIPFAPIV